MTKYHYEVDLEVRSARNSVTNLFVDKEKMFLWEKGLICIVEESNTLFDIFNTKRKNGNESDCFLKIRYPRKSHYYMM